MENLDKLFGEINTFLGWERNRIYLPPKVNRRKRKETELTRQIAHVFKSEVWASPLGKHYHIDVVSCGVVSNPTYSDKYVIIPPAQVFNRKLAPCPCALHEEDKNG